MDYAVPQPRRLADPFGNHGELHPTCQSSHRYAAFVRTTPMSTHDAQATTQSEPKDTPTNLHCLSIGASAYTLAARLQGGLHCTRNSTTTRTLSTSSSTTRRAADRTKVCISGWFIIRRRYFCGGHIYSRWLILRSGHGRDASRRVGDWAEVAGVFGPRLRGRPRAGSDRSRTGRSSTGRQQGTLRCRVRGLAPGQLDEEGPVRLMRVSDLEGVPLLN
jgi:hypothetical protein